MDELTRTTHRWSPEDDSALLKAAEALAGLDLPRGVLWPAVAGTLARDHGLRVTPAACSSRVYRMAQQAREPAPATETLPEARAAEVVVEAVEDGWTRTARLAEEYEADAMERIENKLDEVLRRLGSIEALWS